MINKMTPSEERRLTKIAQEVIAASRSMAPTDALIKAAHSHDLLPEQVRRIAEAYNTSRTLYQLREKQSSVKLQEFPLADPDKALSVVFPTTYPTVGHAKAASQARQQCIRESLVKPENLIAKMAKQASLQIDNAPTPVAEPRRPDPMKELDRASYIAKQAKQRKGEAGVVLTDRMQKAAAAVRASFSKMAFATLEGALHMRYGTELGASLCDLLYTAANGAACKQARAEQIRPVAVNTFLEPFDSIDAFYQATTDFTAAAREYDEADKVAVEKRAAFDLTQKTVGGLFGGLSSLNESPAYKKELAKAYQKVENPDHRDELNSIRVKALLSDLMGNDEVISTYDPEEVMDRYNELSKLSPQVAQQPMLVRPILRRALQHGTVDPFEVNQYVSTGKALGDQTKIEGDNAQQLGNDPQLKA